MKWVQPWFLRMMACHTASRGPPIRIARLSSDKLGGVARVAIEDGLIGPHPGVVIDVARLGQADHGVDQQVGLGLGRGPHGQLDVGAVHRIAGLEGHDLAPALAGELRAQLGRRAAQQSEVVVERWLQTLEACRRRRRGWSG